MTAQVDSIPRLPPELERTIFEGAALEWHRKEAARLLLVARRVCDWIRPLLYSVFNQGYFVNFPSFAKYSSLKLADIGQFAEHLLVRDGEEVHNLLSSCPNVRDLALWYGTSLSKHIDTLRSHRLTRLSADFRKTNFDMLRAPTFLGLTHLEISAFYYDLEGSDLTAITELPRLSHLSIPFKQGDLAPSFLKQCVCLRVLLITNGKEHGNSEFITTGSLDLRSIEDVRMVLMLSDSYVESEKVWISGALGRTDSWITAEIHTLARRGDFLKRSTLEWITSQYNWDEALNETGKEWYLRLSIS